MPRAAVIGHPVVHSLSPVLHTAAYDALGLHDWQYDAIDCEVAGLPDLLAGSDAEWAGFSCTMPLKRVALELADVADPVAVAVGAANTLVSHDGRWHAAMTDVAGIAGALAECGVAPHSVTVLGAGGTAQAVVGALVQLQIATCAVLVRDLGRTAELRRTADRLGVELSFAVLAVDAEELAADLVVSTLPRGAADGLAARRWRADQAVLDVVYDPWPTPLAAAAARAGSTVVSGALMLLHQAGEQVRLMTGRPAPVEAMRAALKVAAPDAGL
jgi:shikimate dehydrogenase